MNPNATMKDVAKASGVSYQSVSRILSGGANLHSPTTVRRVEMAAKKLGYIPNLFAIGLQGRKTRSVGIVIDPSKQSFTGEIFRGIYDILMERNYLPILLFHSLDDPVDAVVRRLAARRVEGFIIHPNLKQVQDVADSVRKYRLPVICVDEYLSNDWNTDFVGTDDALGSRKGIEHLLRLGHRRFAALFIDKPNLKVRFEAVEETLTHCEEKCFLQRIDRWDFDDNSRNQKRIRKILQQQAAPTAIVACGDFMLPPIYNAIHELGLRIPEDISVLGFGDTNFSRCLVPPVTTLKQDAYGVGSKAAEILIDRLNNPEESPVVKSIRFSPSLLVRGSTAQPKSRNRTKTNGDLELQHLNS
ncbi:LacI family DNA-binding transcriptional regulator [Pontiella agarivorans]|uniref:LacI family DNA-binding transcriptional regulator n=1 Tax=Pontiella agarivorans TaxID=3038953 RepID=A0ABU5MY74_9BACT|nr:LacI family DNA-binding transcriptional regulator [Pontiella agarivorans]MDZ8119142.1 LacI family DNA-binding transcriptional regulator [Pontiella agarivorans]